MRKKALFISSLLFLSLSLSGQYISPGYPHFKNLTIAEGLTNNEVKSFFQDENGFVWLGTGSGVDRFDGYDFKPFRPYIHHEYEKEKLSWRPIRILIGQNGNFYLGSDFAGLQIYDQEQHAITHYTRDNSPIPGNHIQCMVSDRKGNIWIGTDNGMTCYNPEQQTFLPAIFSQRSIPVIIVDRKGNIWFYAENEGIFCYDFQKETISKAPFTMEGKVVNVQISVNDICLGRQNRLLIASDQGIWEYSPERGEIKQIPEFMLKGYQAFGSILEDKNGNIWAGTASQGLVFFQKAEKKTTVFLHNPFNPASIISNKITCIFEDNQQNIWIGSNGEGISILSPDFARFGVFLPQGPEGKNGVSSLSRSRQGTIWAGIDQGLLQISAEGNPQYFNLPDKLICHQPIGPVAAINETQVFLGTACGIKRWSPLRPTEVAEVLASPIPQNHLLSLHYIEPDLYIGTSLTDSLKGLWIYHTEDHSMSQYISSESPRGISGNHITKVLQSSSGQTWIGTWAELNLMKAENEFFHTKAFIQNPECLRGGNSTGSIMEDHLGNIWFGRIDEGGLLVINPQTGQFNCFGMESGLPNLSVTAIMQDYRKDIWIGTYLRISRIRYPKNPFSSKELTIVHFKIKDGLPTNIMTDGIAAKGGKTLYFGTGAGLIRLFPENILPDTIPPIIQFTDFKLFNSSVISHPLSPVLKREIHEVDLISLNHRQNVFSIEFAGLNYFENEENSYAYRLQGVDPDWIETGKRHVITYSQLKPGRYLLEVKGKSSKSSWSEPVQLSVLIHPPFWQQWWFFVLAGMGIALAAYSFHAYRIRQIQRVQEIRNRIAADLHDDIGTTLSNIEILSFLGTQNPDNPEQEKRFFHKIRKEAKQSNEALHHIVWSINPENDYLNTVVSHLVRTALEILEPSGINVEVQRPEFPDSFKLISEKRKDLHLAFKEIITNISKYAQASTVDITFLLQRKELRICIRDNGIGLSDLAWEKGSGLKNIQKRMEKWRGKAQFQNLPDQGLEITLRIPVP